MMFFRAVFSLCFTLAASSFVNDSFGSKDIFGSVDSLNNLYRQNKDRNPELAFSYAIRALETSSRIGYDDGEAMACRHLGGYNNRQGNYKEARKFLKRGLSLFQKTGNILGVTYCLNGLGNSESAAGNYSIAMEYYVLTLQLNRQNNSRKGEGQALHNIGTIHVKQGQLDQSQYYFDQAVRIAEELGDKKEMAISINGLAGVEAIKGNFQKGINYGLQAVLIAREIEAFHEVAAASDNIGFCYYYLEQYDSAELYFRNALDIQISLMATEGIATSFLNLYSTSASRGDFELAAFYADRGLGEALKYGNKSQLSKAYHIKSDVFESQQKFDSSLFYYKLYKSISDSLTGINAKNRINELQEKFNAVERDSRIGELESENKATDLRYENRLTILTSVIVILILSLLLIVFYFRQRKAREGQRISELEQQALRAQMSPHFIFNSLNSIQRLYIEGETSMASNYMADFSTLMRKILDSTSQNRIRLNEEIEMLKLYCEMEKLRSGGMMDYLIEIDDSIVLTETWVPPIIIQPFVENAVWHGILPKKEKGTVKIILSMKGGRLKCIVEDNGVGFNQSEDKKKHESKGIKLTEERIGDSVLIENLNPGSRITFLIPLK